MVITCGSSSNNRAQKILHAKTTGTSLPNACTPITDINSLSEAIRRNDINSVEIALNNNRIWAEAHDEQGYQPIHVATQEGHVEIVRMLLDEFGAKHYAETTKGKWIPAHQCAKYGHCEIFRILIGKGEKVDVRRKNKYLFTPLFWAVQQGHTSFVRMLIEEFNVSTKEESGTFHKPLHLASECGQAEIIRYLLTRRHENPNMKQSDRFGYTPLHWACRMGHLEAVKVLLDNNADYDAKTSTNGQTPLMLAEKYEKTEVVVFVKEHIRRKETRRRAIFIGLHKLATARPTYVDCDIICVNENQ
ncbi:ankyrin [Acrasis kona]|uniref:Ankyrin n=1 Tax=Acrasis kona TaxID=1008807 RepID=A0AAW2ZBX3_9EUKA